MCGERMKRAAFTNRSGRVNRGRVSTLSTRVLFGLFPILSVVIASPPALAERSAPIALHPQNPHYFLFRGRPTVLIGSGEHYGAVLNLDFDYIPYLDELRSRHLNLTRTWVGSYREIPGSFGITDNTLAPQPYRFTCPWARSSTPGY